MAGFEKVGHGAVGAIFGGELLLQLEIVEVELLALRERILDRTLLVRPRRGSSGALGRAGDGWSRNARNSGEQAAHAASGSGHTCRADARTDRGRGYGGRNGAPARANGSCHDGSARESGDRGLRAAKQSACSA